VTNYVFCNRSFFKILGLFADPLTPRRRLHGSADHMLKPPATYTMVPQILKGLCLAGLKYTKMHIF